MYNYVQFNTNTSNNVNIFYRYYSSKNKQFINLFY